MVEGGAAGASTRVPSQPLLARRVFDVQLLDLVRRDGADADQRVLEVGAHLPGGLAMSPLELAAKSLVDVALRTHHALLTVLLAAVGRRSALPALARLLGADQAGLAVVVPAAQLALAEAVHEHAHARHALDVDADGAGAAVVVGAALAAVAGGLRVRLGELLVEVRGVLEALLLQVRPGAVVVAEAAVAAAVAQVGEHLGAEAVEDAAPGRARRRPHGQHHRRRQEHGAGAARGHPCSLAERSAGVRTAARRGCGARL